MQVPANSYLSEVSSLSEGNVGIEEDSETCSRSTKERQTRGQNIRRKFNKRMQFFLAQGGHVVMMMRQRATSRFS